MDLSKLTLDELLKVQAELETIKEQLNKARTEKFNAIFPKAIDLFLSNGVSLSSNQIEAIKGLIGSGPQGGIGGFISISSALVSAGVSYVREYKEINGKNFMFLIRAKSTKVHKTKETKVEVDKPTVNNTAPAPAPAPAPTKKK